MVNVWLDLFAGHGVGVAMQRLGITEHAVEIWEDAIRTRVINGLSKPLYNNAWDIERYNGSPEGLWASPPCQTFSTAGSGSGRVALSDVLRLIDSRVWEDPERLRGAASAFSDPRTGLVLTPLAYVHRLAPTYVVMEQVTPVLSVWEAFAKEMRAMGYSVWTGILDAADYGVPQNRRRAYLIATRKDKATPPPVYRVVKTLKDIRPDQQGLISNYSSGSGGIEVPGNKKPRGYRRIDQHSFTVTGKVRANRWHPSGELVTMREALMMQSYPPDFKVAGNWSLQVGNAVPPKLAERVIGHLIGPDVSKQLQEEEEW